MHDPFFPDALMVFGAVCILQALLVLALWLRPAADARGADEPADLGE